MNKKNSKVIIYNVIYKTNRMKNYKYLTFCGGYKTNKNYRHVICYGGYRTATIAKYHDYLVYSGG